MRYGILLFFLFICNSLLAQIDKNNIWGSWVINKINYKDGSELPDDNIIKNQYLKYTFSNPEDLYTSILFYAKGIKVHFEISNDILIIKTIGGSPVNAIRIESLTTNRLVLLFRGSQGFDSPDAIRYSFIPEPAYQKSIRLTSNDIHSISGNDTVYTQNPKIYAIYKGDDFHQFLSSNVSNDPDYMHNKSGHIVVSFIVSKAGLADSLKILESISPDYDRRFIRAFNKAKHDWKPAKLNGKFVRVLMFEDIRYLMFSNAISDDRYILTMPIMHLKQKTTTRPSTIMIRL